MTLDPKILYYVAQVLGVVPPPEVYLQDNRPGGIQLANTVEKNTLIPSFVVGQDLLQGRSEKEIAFIVSPWDGTFYAGEYAGATPYVRPGSHVESQDLDPPDTRRGILDDGPAWAAKLPC